MRFAVFGAGGLGAYYGARLVEAGYEVSFIARGPHLEAMKKNGLKVISPVGDVHLEKLQVTNQTADIGAVDVVIIAVKSWHIAEIIPLLPNSKPFNNFVSDPGKIKKFGILSLSYRLYVLSFTPTICLGKFLTNFSIMFMLNE